MTKKQQNIFWFLIVVGFLSLGIGMIIWTVKQASSVPVHESNDFMLKYQMADLNINTILTLKKDFDKNYNINIKNVEILHLKENNVNSKRVQLAPVKLTEGENHFSYAITTKAGQTVEDANVTFLLSRPHSRNEDALFENIGLKNGLYTTPSISITKAGRYTLNVRVHIKDVISYLTTMAYLEPKTHTK